MGAVEFGHAGGQVDAVFAGEGAQGGDGGAGFRIFAMGEGFGAGGEGVAGGDEFGEDDEGGARFGGFLG